MTAGNHKRTIDIIGDVTGEGKAKLTEQLDDIHTALKDHVALARPKIRESIEEVRSAEQWLAVQAKELGLVDEIITNPFSGECDIIENLKKVDKRKSMLSTFSDSIRTGAENLRQVTDRLQSTAEAPAQSPTPIAIV